MDERERLARLRAEEIRETLAIGKTERDMTDEERALAQEMERLQADEESTKRHIEDEWREEHWGHEPEPPPSWRKGQSDPRHETPDSGGDPDRGRDRDP